jgi:hypothetical protein
MKAFPQHWYIKVTKDNQAILDKWRLSVAIRYTGTDLLYGHYVLSDTYDGSYFYTCDIRESENYHKYTEIDLETFLQITQSNMSTKSRTITPQQAQSIIDIACARWKENLFNEWGKNIVLKNDIIISEEYYQQMRVACTPTQHVLFDEIFGKDSPLKVGDWVKIIQASIHEGDILQLTEENFQNIHHDYHIRLTSTSHHQYKFPNQVRLATEEEINSVKYPKDGTSCLVSNGDDDWSLRYADGKGRFYNNGVKKSDYASFWKHYRIIDLDGISLDI